MSAASSNPETAAAAAPPPITIFLSLCSADLGPVRRKIADELASPTVHVVTMENFDHEPTGLVEKLEKLIAGSVAVVHVAGHAFGAALPGDSGRSYTQIEWDIARKQGRKIYACVCADGFEYPKPFEQGPEAAQRQAAHREAVRKSGIEYFKATSVEALAEWVGSLKIEVQQLRGEYADYRRRMRHWFAMAAGIVVLLGAWFWFQNRDIWRAETEKRERISDLRGKLAPYRPRIEDARRLVAELERPGPPGQPLDLAGQLRKLRAKKKGAEVTSLREAQQIAADLATLLAEDPVTALDAAYLSLATGQEEKAFPFAFRAAQRGGTHGAESFKLLALLMLFEGDTVHAQEYADRAIKLLPADKLMERARLGMLLGFSLLGSGDSAGGAHLLRAGRAVAEDATADADQLAVYAGWLAYVLDLHDNKVAARRLYEQLIAEMERIKPANRELPVLIRNQLALLLDRSTDPADRASARTLLERTAKEVDNVLPSASLGAVLTRLNLAFLECKQASNPDDGAFERLKAEAAGIRAGTHGKTFLEFEAWDKYGRACFAQRRWGEALVGFENASTVIENLVGARGSEAIGVRVRQAVSAFKAGKIGDCQATLEKLLLNDGGVAVAGSDAVLRDLDSLAEFAGSTRQEILAPCQLLRVKLASATSAHAK